MSLATTIRGEGEGQGCCRGINPTSGTAAGSSQTSSAAVAPTGFKLHLWSALCAYRYQSEAIEQILIRHPHRT